MTTKIKLFDLKARKSHIEHKRRRYALRRHMETPGFNAADIKAKLAEMDAAPEAILACPHAADIHAALSDVNGKATAHTYTTVGALIDIASDIEAKLERHGVPLADRVGVTVSALSAVPTSKSYNRQSRSAIATRVTFLRGTSAWYVTGMERVERYTGPGGDEKIKATLPDAARDAVIRNALADFE